MTRLPVRPSSGRRWVVVAILCAGLAAAFWLKLVPSGLVPSDGGLTVVSRFFRAAFMPTLTYEAEFVPESAPPLLVRSLLAGVQTIIFALAAVSLAVVVGFVLALVGSSAWWTADLAGPRARAGRWIGPTLYGFARTIIGLMRSVHELIWAVLFLSAMGLTHVTAVVAIAIPYAGTFAKVFSEILEEAPTGPARALRSVGATPWQTMVVGLVPIALPDLFAYALYRLECGLRSAAVLGFFGIPTLGLSIKLSFENTHYREVWTYLYTLVGMIVLFEWWSGAVRRRLTR